jgi:hypothetical protein
MRCRRYRLRPQPNEAELPNIPGIVGSHARGYSGV